MRFIRKPDHLARERCAGCSVRLALKLGNPLFKTHGVQEVALGHAGLHHGTPFSEGVGDLLEIDMRGEVGFARRFGNGHEAV